MGWILLAAFIGVPLVEIAVFIQIGGEIGLGWTLAIVILTAIAGSWLLRRQGLSTLARAQAEMDRGVMPVQQVFDGVCLLIAGCLLLTPGFVTDALGALLFIPPLRVLLARLVLARILNRAEFRVHRDGAWRDDGIIDGDFEEVRPNGPGEGREKPRLSD